jgi:hypothetical protein
MAYCSSCGSQTSVNARFCAYCGTDLIQQSAHRPSAPEHTNKTISAEERHNKRKKLPSVKQTLKDALKATTIVLGCMVLFVAVNLGIQKYQRSREPGYVYTYRDSPEYAKKEKAIQEQLVGCGNPGYIAPNYPSNSNYPEDSDVPLMHMLHQEELAQASAEASASIAASSTPEALESRKCRDAVIYGLPYAPPAPPLPAKLTAEENAAKRKVMMLMKTITVVPAPEGKCENDKCFTMAVGERIATWKTDGQWRKVKAMSGKHKGEEGWAVLYVEQMKPLGR